MTAITIANSAKLTGLVTDRKVNTNDRVYKILVVEDSAAGVDETYDLALVSSGVAGIAGPLTESFAGAATSTAGTWSTTTITVKGAGAYIGAWLVY